MAEDVSQGIELDETKIALLEAAFNNDYTITQACQYAGIGRATYYRWLDDPIFKERMEVAQNMPLRKAREVVVKAINGEDPNMAFKFLQARDPEYKHKASVEYNPALEETRQKLKDFMDEDDDGTEHDLPDNDQASQS